MTLLEAIQASLDDRWYKMEAAKSIIGMRIIFNSSICALCHYYNNPCGLKINCGYCQLRDVKAIACCKEYSEWWKAFCSHDLPAAQSAANALVLRLEKLKEEIG